MKNKSRWFWCLAVLCMMELAAVFLINSYILNDGYYHFEPSFEKSRYVERNLGNSVFDIIGVEEGWRDESWLGKLDKRDVEYIAVFGDRKYANVDYDHTFSNYDLTVSWKEKDRAEIEGRLSPMFEEEVFRRRDFTSGTLKAGIPEKEARAAESKWEAGRRMMVLFGAAMMVVLGILWYVGGKMAERTVMKEGGLLRVAKMCFLMTGLLMCLRYFYIFGIRIHRGTWPEWCILLLMLLAALGAVGGILLMEQIHQCIKTRKSGGVVSA